MDEELRLNGGWMEKSKRKGEGGKVVRSMDEEWKEDAEGE